MRARILAALVAVFAADGQAVELEDCRLNAGPAYPGIKARCGTLERPLDPAAPDGETIELAVAVVAALTLEPAADPVLPIAGGPGQGTIEFYAGSFVAFEPLRRDRDIVLVDQRGTGRSARLDCPVDDEVMEGRLSYDETVRLTRECLDALPQDPRFFTTSAAVADLEAVRAALGYETLNVYGVSYGTRVAQHYARRYPTSTRSLILDGVVPPQLALGPDIPIQAQRAVDEIFARCAEQVDCSAAFADLAARFAALRLKLERTPVEVTLPHPSTGRLETLIFGENEFSAAIRLLAYQAPTIALIPFLVDSAANGRFEPLAAQFLTTRDSLGDSIATGMHNAVMCTEDAPYFAGEGITDEELAETYLGPMMMEALDAMCSVWPTGIIDDDFKTPLATDLPVLLLSGDADPITPPDYATVAAAEMSNHLPVTASYQGHGLGPRGCTPQIMADFVAAASVDAVDAGCLDKAFAMPFFLGLGGPSP